MQGNYLMLVKAIDDVDHCGEVRTEYLLVVWLKLVWARGLQWDVAV